MIPYPSPTSPYHTNRRKNTPTYIEYLPHPPHPRLLSLHTCAHLTLPFITYPNLHFPTLYYCKGSNDPGLKRLRPKRPRPKRLKAEMTQDSNDSGPKRPENAVAVVEQERTCRVIHPFIWLSIFVRVRIFRTFNIFVIIVFPYTHDTGAVTSTEPGDEFYTLPLIEINIAAFQPFNTTLCIRDATEFWTSEIRCNDTRQVEL